MSVERGAKVKRCIGCNRVASVVAVLPSGERICEDCAELALDRFHDRRPEVEHFRRTGEAL